MEAQQFPWEMLAQFPLVAVLLWILRDMLLLIERLRKTMEELTKVVELLQQQEIANHNELRRNSDSLLRMETRFAKGD